MARNEIKRLFAAQGIKKNGKPFAHGTLSNMLKNRKYIGEIVFGDQVNPNSLPAIVDKDIFERAQIKKIERKRHQELIRLKKNIF